MGGRSKVFFHRLVNCLGILFVLKEEIVVSMWRCFRKVDKNAPMGWSFVVDAPGSISTMGWLYNLPRGLGTLFRQYCRRNLPWRAMPVVSEVGRSRGRRPSPRSRSRSTSARMSNSISLQLASSVVEEERNPYDREKLQSMHDGCQCLEFYRSIKEFAQKSRKIKKLN